MAKTKSRGRFRTKDEKAALAEVKKEPDAAVEKKTAKKWAERAVACYALYDESKTRSWLIRAERYRDEALEHAAQAGDEGATVGRIQRYVDRHRRAVTRKK